jgi:multidrug resistance efflux pump
MRNEVLAQFSYSNIKAPFSGEITNTFIKEGDIANPGMPLVSIEGASRLQVTAMVSETYCQYSQWNGCEGNGKIYQQRSFWKSF